MIGVIAVPAGDVLGTVLPALGVALILGNLYYTFLARRLARRENRTDVTALPYGPSVPHMFIVVFVVMLPVYLEHRRPDAGLASGPGVGVPDRHHRDDRRVRRTLHPQAHPPRGDAGHAGRHLDHLHLDAARRPDVGSGLDRPSGAGHHPDRLLHQREAARSAFRSAWWHCWSVPRSAGPAGTCPHPTSGRPSATSRSASRICESTCCSPALPISRHCSVPRSRSVSTTSPRR